MFMRQRSVKRALTGLRAGLVALVIIVAMAMTSTGASVADEEVGETVPPLPSPVVGGYLLQGTPNFNNIQMDLVTHFFWAFSLVQNGRCSTASTNGINAVLTQRQLRPDLKVIRSIGGWGAGGFSVMSSTQEGRETFVRSCMEAFILNGVADGFDLDWEFPVYGGLPSIGASPDDRINHNLLVDEFRKQLNEYADSQGRSRRDFIITAAIPAGRWQDSGDGVTGAPFDTDTSFDLRTLGRTLDHINVMTYDMGTGYSPVSMFNQPLRRHSADPTGDPYNGGEEAIQYFEDHGVPREKMAYGTEFTLSRGFTVTTTQNNGLFQPWTSAGCGQTTPNNAMNLNNTSIMINWDPEVESQYLWNPTTRIFCSYETPHSLYLRSKFSKDAGLNGTFSWQLTGDSLNSQLRAVALPWFPEKVVAAPAPTVTGEKFFAVRGEPFSGPVARVTGSSAPSLTAIVNWGDVSRSAGVVTSPSAGNYTVSGTHTYGAAGRHRLTVTTIDPDPINSRMFNAEAVVWDEVSFDALAELVEGYYQEGALNRAQERRMHTHLATGSRLAAKGKVAQAERLLDRALEIAADVDDDDARTELLAMGDFLKARL
jgi:GH18 family chitinase